MEDKDKVNVTDAEILRKVIETRVMLEEITEGTTMQHRYRARILRGRLEVGLRTQGGTRVLCSCPAQPQ